MRPTAHHDKGASQHAQCSAVASVDPANLPAAFAKDGLKVEADAQRRDDMAGIHMTGPIVQIVRIRAR